MKHKDLANITKDNVELKINELRKELIKLKAQSNAGASMDNPGRIRSVKRSIAQLNTIKKIGFSGGKIKK
jgi:large subunit ribosomal protein L29